MSGCRGHGARTAAVGVTIPVNNEESLLGTSLASVTKALSVVGRRGLRVAATVVLDSCVDDSLTVARRWQRWATSRHIAVTLVECEVGNVGAARSLGCSSLVTMFEELDISRLWIATTDADSRVPRNWLRNQVSAHETGVDAWAGRIEVTDWSQHSRNVAAKWQKDYDEELHPVHGTNMGFNARDYLAVGGFRPQATGEDRALLADLIAHGAAAYFDSSTRVRTSARREARAPNGFSAVLNFLDSTVLSVAHSFQGDTAFHEKRLVE